MSNKKFPDPPPADTCASPLNGRYRLSLSESSASTSLKSAGSGPLPPEAAASWSVSASLITLLDRPILLDGDWKSSQNIKVPNYVNS